MYAGNNIGTFNLGLYMMLRIILSGFVLLHLCATAHAQNCSSVTRPSFNFENEEADFHNAVYKVDAGWEGKWKDLTEPERLEQQEATVARIIAAYVKKHGTSHSQGNCVNGLANMCPLAEGSDHSCATAGPIGLAQQRLPMTLENRNRDFQSGADYSGNLH